jgi:hypothetical protein
MDFAKIGIMKEINKDREQNPPLFISNVRT